MIDVTLIGTGALQPLPERALASAAIACSGRVLLIDCGEGTQSAAKRAGVSLVKIDAIALTHYHGDHTFGLPGLLQSMAMAGRTEPVVITGPRGLHEAMKPFRMLCPNLPFELRLLAMPKEGLAMDEALGWPEGTVLMAFETYHRVESRGYRFELRRRGQFLPEKAKVLGVPVQMWKALQRGERVMTADRVVEPGAVMGEARRGLAVVYTGDTAFHDALALAAREADLLICEATYGEAAQAELAAQHGHMTFFDAALLAARAQAGALWLTHYSPMITGPEAHVPCAAAVFPQVICGADGMKTTLRFGK